MRKPDPGPERHRSGIRLRHHGAVPTIPVVAIRQLDLPLQVSLSEYSDI